jgi:2-keto-4-pentenoate hydratase
MTSLGEHPRQQSVARALRDAESNRVPIRPIRDQLSEPTIAAAYAVQQLNAEYHRKSGRIVGGHKIGLTSRTVQLQLGVDQPDFGILWKDTEYLDGALIPWNRLLQPKIEAEIALVLARDVDAPYPGLSDVLRATDYVLPALEIVGSRIANWEIGICDTIADNASSGLYVLGGPPRKPDGLDLRLCGMVIFQRGEPVSEGCGAACLGHPLAAAVWLARELATAQTPLRAGEVILTGALGKMVPVAAGDVFEAHIGGVGSVRAEIGGAD